MTEYEAKVALIAKILEGRVVHDEPRVLVCIKGIVLGFPATLEAIQPSFPFGVTYFLETNVIEDPNAQPRQSPLKLVITPRIGRGLFSFFSRLLLLEAKGQKVDIPQIDSAFVCSFDNIDATKRFLHYPAIQEKLVMLAKYSQFTELLIKTDAGICLSQPTSLNALGLDVCKETFRLLGELGQVIFDNF